MLSINTNTQSKPCHKFTTWRVISLYDEPSAAHEPIFCANGICFACAKSKTLFECECLCHWCITAYVCHHPASIALLSDPEKSRGPRIVSCFSYQPSLAHYITHYTTTSQYTTCHCSSLGRCFRPNPFRSSEYAQRQRNGTASVCPSFPPNRRGIPNFPGRKRPRPMERVIAIPGETFLLRRRSP